MRIFTVLSRERSPNEWFRAGAERTLVDSPVVCEPFMVRR